MSPDSPRRVSLSGLIACGAPNGTIHFDDLGAAHNAAALAETGQRLVSNGADSPVIAMIATNDPESVAVLLGAILAGAKVVSLPTPGRNSDLDSYVSLLKSALKTHSAKRIVARPDIVELLESVGVPATTIDTQDPLAIPSESGFSLVQYTSGSTGLPMAIELSDTALGANVAAIIDAIEPVPGDCAVSWLPISHDMGLVGMLFTSIASAAADRVGRGKLILIDPQTFLRAPTRWFEIITSFRGTITAAPDFALRLMTRLDRNFSGIDLSSMRCMIVGGEIVRAETLKRFCDAYSINGIRRSAICPSYGMAEAGVAIAMTRPGIGWSERMYDTDAVADHRLSASVPSKLVSTLVSSGPPLPGYSVRSDAQVTRVGQLSIIGPSIGNDATTGNSLAGQGGWFTTNDVGFVIENDVFVCGRNDDYIIAHGRNIFAPAVEAAATDIYGLRDGRLLVFSVPTGEWIAIGEVAQIGQLTSQDREQIERAVRSHIVTVTGMSPDVVALVPRGKLPMTSSGKPQRNQTQHQYTRGELDTL